MAEAHLGSLRVTERLAGGAIALIQSFSRGGVVEIFSYFLKNWHLSMLGHFVYPPEEYLFSGFLILYFLIFCKCLVARNGKFSLSINSFSLSLKIKFVKYLLTFFILLWIMLMSFIYDFYFSIILIIFSMININSTVNFSFYRLIIWFVFIFCL